jgi:RNA polymerase sigma-70 factor (ECF subfamily)
VVVGDPLSDSAPGPSLSDLENTRVLLHKARAGDRSAANEIFARYEERIRRIVRVRLGPALRRWTESGDLVQETCRAALEGFEKLELTDEFDLVDWLSRVATNRIRDFVDHVHAEKRDVARVQPLTPSSGDGSGSSRSPADTQEAPSERAFRAEVRELLDEIVAGLPDDYREVVLLRDYHGADWATVARALSARSLHAAQQLHQRAWIKVRAQAAPRLAGLARE